jgi:hypothetical protein
MHIFLQTGGSKYDQFLADLAENWTGVVESCCLVMVAILLLLVAYAKWEERKRINRLNK